jgi:hypothetical protein
VSSGVVLDFYESSLGGGLVKRTSRWVQQSDFGERKQNGDKGNMGRAPVERAHVYRFRSYISRADRPLPTLYVGVERE